MSYTPTVVRNVRMRKVYLIAFAICWIYLLLHFNSSIDSFAPLQISAIDETIERGFLLDAYRNTVPTFYVLGSELAMILGKNSDFLLFSPIQLIPYAVLFFVLILKISNSFLLASLISITELTTGLTGTQRIFFWPHGVGTILYFSLLVLFLLMFFGKSKSAWQYQFMAIIIGISLVFTSYDVIFTYLLFLLSFILYIMIFNNTHYLSRDNLDFRWYQSIKLFILLIIVEMGLTEFVYNNFIHALKSPDSFTMSGLDKFLLSYFSTNIQDNIIRDLYLQYPDSVTYYGYVKYGILLVFLTIFLINFISSRRLKYKLESIFIISILSSMVIWAAIRLLIGHVEVGFFYYPAIFSIAWVYRNGRSFKRWALVGAVLLLALNPVYHFMVSTEDLSNKDVNQFNYLHMPLSWCRDKTSDSEMRSDELTKNFYHMAYRTQDFQTLDVNDVAFLLNRRENSPNNYFILNNNLKILDIGNWIQIKPWMVTDHLLNKNIKVNKILDSEKISIYTQSQPFS